MISWTSNRVVVMVVALLLTASAIRFVGVMEAVAREREARMLADVIANDIDRRLEIGGEIRTTISAPDPEIGVEVKILQQHVMVIMGDSTVLSPLNRDLYLWNPGDRIEWTSYNIEEKNKNNSVLLLDEDASLISVFIRVDGMRTQKHFMFIE